MHPFTVGVVDNCPSVPLHSLGGHNCSTRCQLQMFLKPQVSLEYGNQTCEHQSGHQSSYWRTSVPNFSNLTKTVVTHSPPWPTKPSETDEISWSVRSPGLKRSPGLVRSWPDEISWFDKISWFEEISWSDVFFRFEIPWFVEISWIDEISWFEEITWSVMIFVIKSGEKSSEKADGGYKWDSVQDELSPGLGELSLNKKQRGENLWRWK